MSRFLALIVAVAVALFIAGPAMAQPIVNKTVDNSNTANTTFDTTVTVTKDVFIDISSGEEPIPAEGLVNVSGDSIFKELDVNVQDQEAVVKFFELDDSASSTWFADGVGIMTVAEQLQNGLDNVAEILQHNQFNRPAGMQVALQYQVGNDNFARSIQGLSGPDMNNFAKQIQVGNSNTAIGFQSTQDFPGIP